MQLIAALTSALNKPKTDIVMMFMNGNKSTLAYLNHDVTIIGWDAPKAYQLTYFCGGFLPLNLFKAAKTATFYGRAANEHEKEVIMMYGENVVKVTIFHDCTSISHSTHSFESIGLGLYKSITHTDFFEMYFTALNAVKNGNNGD